MKKFLKSCAIVVMVAMFVSGKAQSNSPSDVTVNFEKAMIVLNFDSAKMYATSNSFALLNQIKGVYGMVLPDSVEQILLQTTVKATSETKVDDSTADVEISVTLPKPIMGQQKKENTMVLKKENGAWKVDLWASAQKTIEDMNDQQHAMGASPSTLSDSAGVAVPSKN